MQEAAVTGSPDDIYGLIVKAFVIHKFGFQSSETLVKEIQNPIRKVTAPYKYSRVIEFVNSLPKTISGKIRRKELRDREMKKTSNEISAPKKA